MNKQEYKIVKETCSLLPIEIKKLINSGWECQGGVSVYNGKHLMQAMVRTNKPNEGTLK